MAVECGGRVPSLTRRHGGPMRRIARSLILAAGIALCAAPAFAHEYRGEERTERFERARWEARRELRKLENVRDRFFARWNGSPWSRARFDAWYARRREEIRERFAWLERERRWH